MAAKGKTNLTTPLLILLLLVGAGWFVFRPAVQESTGGAEADKEGAAAANVLVPQEKDAITRLDIATPNAVSYSLLKQEDKWYALKDGKQYLADSERTGKLLTDLAGLKSDALVSEKAEQHPTFELGEDQAYSVAVYAGGSDPVLTLLVGKSTPNVQGCYVRMAGEDKVFKATANLKTSLGFSFDDYRSRQLWQYDPLLATSVSVTKVGEDGVFAGEPLKFRRDGELWVLDSDGSNGNQNDLKELVDKFSGLRVQSFLEGAEGLPVEQYDPAKSTPCLVVEAGGQSYKLTIRGKEEGNIVVEDGAGLLYKTSRANLGFLLDLDFEKLTFYEPPPPAEADAAATGDAAAADTADAAGTAEDAAAEGGESAGGSADAGE